jgi:hypothetical protein
MWYGLPAAKEPASLARFKESEVIHGRWAMLGAAGVLGVEVLGEPLPAMLLLYLCPAQSAYSLGRASTAWWAATRWARGANCRRLGCTMCFVHCAPLISF